MSVSKILNAVLILTSFFGYLEWADQHAYIYQVEIDLLLNLTEKISSFTHPLIILPLVGQLLLLVTIFQKHPSKKLTLLGIGCLSSIMLMLLFIGILSKSYAIILYALPFVVTAFGTVLYALRKKEA